MTPDRLQTIQNDALDEAQWARSILESEIDAYDDFTAARIVQRLCKYIDELINTIKQYEVKVA
jgi:hypothetical protein